MKFLGRCEISLQRPSVGGENGAALILCTLLIAALIIVLSMAFGLANLGTSSLQQHGLAKYSAEAALMTLVKTVAESSGRLTTFSPVARANAIDAASRVTSLNFYLLKKGTNQGTNFTEPDGSSISFGYCERDFGSQVIAETRCFPLSSVPHNGRQPCITNAVKVDLKTVGRQHMNHWLLSYNVPLKTGSAIAYLDITAVNRADAQGESFSPYLFIDQQYWGNYYIPGNINCTLSDQAIPSPTSSKAPSKQYP